MNKENIKFIFQLILGALGLGSFTVLYFLRILSLHEYMWPLLVYIIALLILLNIDVIGEARFGFGLGRILIKTKKQVSQSRKTIDKMDENMGEWKSKLEEVSRILKKHPVIKTGGVKFAEVREIEDLRAMISDMDELQAEVGDELDGFRGRVNQVERLVGNAEKMLIGKIMAKSDISANLTVEEKLEKK